MPSTDAPPGRGCPSLRPRPTLAAAAAVGLVLLGTLLVSLPSSPAGAIGVSGGGGMSFGASPAPQPGGGSRAYFNYTLAAGQSTTDAVVVTNSSTAAQTLKMSASTGITATGSGDAYYGYFAPCTGTGCWVTGLPPTVTLPANGTQTVPFTVTVPAGTAPMQYLAGITVEPTTTSAPTKLGSKGGASAQAVIVHQINIGVAVTVGALSSLSSRLTVSNLTIGSVGSTPRLFVHEQNEGQTFTHATGTAVCTAGGGQRTYPVVSDTVLPGEGAVLPVNAPGLPAGSAAQCTVRLGYGEATDALWHGTVAVPSVTPTTIIHTGPGQYSSVPLDRGIPTWAIALMVVGGVVSVLLLFLLWALLRRRKKDDGVVAGAIGPDNPDGPADGEPRRAVSPDE
jgi:hypothetical protein